MSTIRKINVSQVQGRNPFYGDSEAVLPSGTLVMYEDNPGEFILRVHDGVTEGGNGLKLDQTTSMNGGAVLDSTDGNFEVRGVTNVNAEASGVVNIYTDVQGTGYQWQFGDDGVLTVPASSGITGLNSITVPLNEALTVNLSTQLGLDPLTQSSISIRPSELKSSNFYIGLSTVNNHSIDLLEDEKQVNIGVISSGEFIRIRYGTATPGGLANGSAQIDAGNWGAGLESSVYLTAQNNTWQFRGQDSAIVFPDTTVQTTAYTGSADSASTVAITETNGLTTPMYPAFVDSTSGNEVIRVDQDLTYRTDTNTLSVGSLATKSATLSSTSETVQDVSTFTLTSGNLPSGLSFGVDGSNRAILQNNAAFDYTITWGVSFSETFYYISGLDSNGDPTPAGYGVGGATSPVVVPSGGSIILDSNLSWSQVNSVSAETAGSPPGTPMLIEHIATTLGSITFSDNTVQTTAYTGAYTPAQPTDWNGTPPTTIAEAIDRLAVVVKALNGGTGA